MLNPFYIDIKFFYYIARMNAAMSRQNESVSYFGCIKFSLRLVVV